MLADLVHTCIRWHLEGAALMGELFMQKPNGETFKFQVDGTVLREEDGIRIDWCDKCEKWQPLEFGRYEKADGLTILWFCRECSK